MAALGTALLAASGVLGGLLAHDGELEPAPDLANAMPGEPVRLKGEPEPFAPELPLRAWRTVTPLLANHTYAMGEAAGGVVLLLTAQAPAPDGTVLADGVVRMVAPHPDDSGRLLVVVAVSDWAEPILFR